MLLFDAAVFKLQSVQSKRHVAHEPVEVLRVDPEPFAAELLGNN